MDEVVRIRCTPAVYRPCVIVVWHPPVVLGDCHVTVRIHCFDVSNVPICEPRDIATPRSFIVRHTRSSSRIDPVTCTFPADTLVAGGERYSTVVQPVSGIARTFAYPFVPSVQDLLASIRSRAYASVIIAVRCQGIGDANRKAERPQI